MIRNLEHTTIGVLFGRTINFIVPRYQRGYAWEQDQIDDFLSDLKKCIMKRYVDGEKIDHFFGGLVCVQNQVAGSGRVEYEVVDGQQRISTFVLLISQLIEKYKIIEHEKREAGDTATSDLVRNRYLDLENKYIKFQDEINRTRVWVNKLTLSDVDKNFYERVSACQNPNIDRASHSRIIYAKNRIETFLDKLIEADDIDVAIDKLKHVQEVLNDDINIILIATENKHNAYKLFQVLNDRGVGLTEGDLLRAKTLELLEAPDYSGIQNEVANLWDEILADPPSVTEDFLKWYYSAYVGRPPVRANLFDQFRKKFFIINDEGSVTHAEAVKIQSEVRILRDNVLILRKIREGQWPYSINIQQIAIWDKHRLKLLINDLGHTNCVPLLLAAVNLDQRIYGEIVHTLEKFVFRYKIICNEHISKANSIYLKYSKNILKEIPDFNLSEFKEELRTLLDERASDVVFSTQLRNNIKYSETRSNKTVKYFLIVLEEYWRSVLDNDQVFFVKDKTRVFDPSATTIEHVYPRNPASVDVDSEIEPLKNNLGNLTILGPNDNRTADNDTYQVKKELLSSTSIILNQVLSENDDWTSTIVRSREDVLIESAQKIFYF